MALAAAVALLGGCAKPAFPAAAPPGVTIDDEPVVFVHRRIPLVFHVLSGEGAPNATTDEDIRAAVAQANAIWQAADVELFVHDVQRVTVRFLHRNEEGRERLSWAAVRGDVATIEPAALSPPFAEDDAAHRAQWLVQIAARLPRDVIHVFVTTFTGKDGVSFGSNCTSPYPRNDGHPFYEPPNRRWSRDGSKGIYCVPMGEGAQLGSLAHELGHYLGGLDHTWQAADRDPGTGSAPWDAWDLVYAPSPSGKGIVRFRSRREAATTRGPFHPVDSNCAGCVETDSRRVVPGSKCNVEFRFVLPKGVATFDTAHDLAAVYGPVFGPRFPGDGYGINIMSYLYSDAETTPCWSGITRSQAEAVQRGLRSSVGHRRLLGLLPRAPWPFGA